MKNLVVLTLFAIFTFACKEEEDASAKNFTKLPSGVTVELFDITFLSPSDAIVVGENGTILKTTDAGQTWNKQSSSATKNLRAVRKFNATTVFACGGGGALLKTTDGGSTWTAINFPNLEGTLMDIAFLNESTWLVAHSRGNIYKTTDGGNSWNVVQSKATDFFTGMYLVGDQKSKIFAYGGGGTRDAGEIALYSSTDNGSTWTKENVIHDQTVTSMDFSSANTGFFTSYYNVVFKTSNLGQNWTRISTPVNTTWREVKFISETEGFLSGEGGKMIYTNDGGNSWTELSTGENSALYSMEYVGTTKTLYVVGTNGTILSYKK